MKIILILVMSFVITAECFGQLVRRKDYDAAFAIQVGGEIGALVPFGKPGVFIRPAGGLKMTFPFTRKWFLGSEINYSQLTYNGVYNVNISFPEHPTFSSYSGDVEARFDIKQIQVPVYLKYMLNCNRASVLFGIYGAYVFDATLNTSLKNGYFEPIYGESGDGTETLKEKNISGDMDNWNAGITVGYEYQIVKHLNAMFRINAGMKEVMKNNRDFGKKLFPLQASLTLSFDFFRIGDCGCD